MRKIPFLRELARRFTLYMHVVKDNFEKSCLDMQEKFPELHPRMILEYVDNFILQKAFS